MTTNYLFQSLQSSGSVHLQHSYCPGIRNPKYTSGKLRTQLTSNFYRQEKLILQPVFGWDYNKISRGGGGGFFFPIRIYTPGFTITRFLGAIQYKKSKNATIILLKPISRGNTPHLTHKIHEGWVVLDLSAKFHSPSSI